MSQQVNLFNPIFQKQKKIFSALPMALALGVLLLGVLAVVYYGRQSVASLQLEARAASERLAQKKARQATLSAEFAPRKKDAALVGQIDAARARLQALRKVSTVLRDEKFGNTRGYSTYFRALARPGVDGLWLTGVSISGTGNEIGVRGRALRSTMVPLFLDRLARDPVMRGKSFASLQIDQPGQKGKGDKDTGEKGQATPFVEFSLLSAAVAEPLGGPPK